MVSQQILRSAQRQGDVAKAIARQNRQEALRLNARGTAVTPQPVEVEKPKTQEELDREVKSNSTYQNIQTKINQTEQVISSFEGQLEGLERERQERIKNNDTRGANIANDGIQAIKQVLDPMKSNLNNYKEAQSYVSQAVASGQSTNFSDINNYVNESYIPYNKASQYVSDRSSADTSQRRGEESLKNALTEFKSVTGKELKPTTQISVSEASKLSSQTKKTLGIEITQTASKSPVLPQGAIGSKIGGGYLYANENMMSVVPKVTVTNKVEGFFEKAVNKLPYPVKSVFQPYVSPEEATRRGLTERQKGFEAAKGIIYAPVGIVKKVQKVEGDRLVSGVEIGSSIDSGYIRNNQQTSTASKLVGYGLKATSSVTPETPVGYATVVYGGIALSKAPKVVQKGIETGFTIYGGSQAVNTKLSTEERITGGVVAGVGFFGLGYQGVKELNAPIIKQTSEGLIVTNQRNQFLGAKVRIDKSGVNILPSDRYLAKIERQPISSEQFAESVQPKEFTIISMKPSKRVSSQGKTVTTYEDINGFGREIQQGSKTIVKVKTGKTEKTIFNGLSPFTNAGKIERASTLKYFDKIGIKGNNAKSLIRLNQPKVVETRFKGKGALVESESGQELLLAGKETQTLVKAQANDKFGVTKTRTGEGKVRYLEVKAVPSGETKEGIELFKGSKESRNYYLTRQGNEFGKLNKQGKVREVENFVTGSKELGQADLPTSNFLYDIGGTKLSKVSKFDISQEAGLSQRVLPKRNKLESSRSKVYQEVGEPDIIVNLDKVNGIIETKGVQGGGSKSSDQYLKQLYKQDLSPVLTQVKPRTISKSNTVKTPKLKGQSLDLIESEYPSMVGGSKIESKSSGLRLGSQLDYTQSDVQPLSLTIPKQQSKVDINQIDNQISNLNTNTKEATVIKEGLSIRSKPRTSEVNLLKLNEVQTPDFKINQVERINEKIKQTEVLKESQQERQTERLGEISRSTQRETNRTKNPTPKNPKIPSILLPSLSKRILTKVEESPDLFEVFVTKGGKDILKSKAKSKEEAEFLLRKELRSTLRAGGFVTKDGNKLRATELTGFSGGEFRLSKTNQYKVIQNRSFRLARGDSQVREIMSFKKAKSKKRLF